MILIEKSTRSAITKHSFNPVSIFKKMIVMFFQTTYEKMQTIKTNLKVSALSNGYKSLK